jgi:hypothetical protein
MFRAARSIYMVDIHGHSMVTWHIGFLVDMSWQSQQDPQYLSGHQRLTDSYHVSKTQYIQSWRCRCDRGSMMAFQRHDLQRRIGRNHHKGLPLTCWQHLEERVFAFECSVRYGVGTFVVLLKWCEVECRAPRHFWNRREQPCLVPMWRRMGCRLREAEVTTSTIARATAPVLAEGCCLVETLLSLFVGLTYTLLDFCSRASPHIYLHL